MVKKINHCLDCNNLIWEGSFRCKSCAHIGLKHSEKTKKKLSEMRKGRKNPFYGKKHTKESILKSTKKGQAHPCWNGGVTIRNGYRFIWTPNGYIREHRLLLLNKLKEGDLVHHKDENSLNNSLSNLEILHSQKEHAIRHHWGRKCD